LVTIANFYLLLFRECSALLERRCPQFDISSSKGALSSLILVGCMAFLKEVWQKFVSTAVDLYPDAAFYIIDAVVNNFVTFQAYILLICLVFPTLKSEFERPL